MAHKHTCAIYRNTDTSTDMNKAAVIVPWGTTTRQDPDFTITANRVTCNFTGWVKVYCNLHYGTTTVIRTTPGIQFFKNAVAHGAISCSSYNRDAPTSMESSTALYEIIQVTSGDIIEVRCSVHGAVGVQNMSTSGTSVLFLERLE